MFGLFSSKKRKQAEFVEKVVELQQDSQKIAEDNTELGKEYLKIAKENTKISESIDSKSERLIALVVQNEETKQSLSQRDVVLRAKEDDMEERRKKIRIQEIDITARISEVRRQESDVKRQDKVLDGERISIKKRENAAQKLAADSKTAKEDCDALKHKLSDKENLLKAKEEQLNAQSRELDERHKKTEDVFKKANETESELAKKERVFEEKCANMEYSLNKKIEEYDRKLEDINTVQQTVDAVKFNDSEEGKKAKIVVQEAIRRAKKDLEDNAHNFSELLDKYGKGTFRGFAVPISEIDNNIEKLNIYYQQIDQHAGNHAHVIGLTDIKDVVGDYLTKADHCRKSWEFSETYRYICYGLATCENYELMAKIISSGQSKDAESSENDEPNYYSMFDIPTNASEEEINAAYKKMAKKWHPDRAPDELKDTYNDKMAQLNKARDILLDKDKRAKYDRDQEQP